MEPIIKEKRKVAGFLPFKRDEDGIWFFLQKRDKRAKRYPDKFGLFGGGLENGESVFDGLIREVQEELTYTPQEALYFSRYETADSVFDVFIEEVAQDFESKVTVQEGEYGAFLSYEELSTMQNVSHVALLVTHQVTNYLAK